MPLNIFGPTDGIHIDDPAGQAASGDEDPFQCARVKLLQLLPVTDEIIDKMAHQRNIKCDRDFF